MVKVCGEKMDVAGKSISTLLDELGYNPKAVAVEIDEEIIPKAEYDETIINDESVVEVVRFVGGG